MTKPLVAIVGRTNVGKSTLFNRIVGRRKAIALGEKGVTRDRHFADAFWDGIEFICVDTGGFTADPGLPLLKQVRTQIDLAVTESNLLVFVVDGTEGLTHEDEIFFTELRKTGKKIVLAVNKADDKTFEDGVSEFYSLGVRELFPVSAEHGKGMSELLDAVKAGLPKFEAVSEEEEGLKIAIIGRPNVGKSTLVNQLVGNERVVVDSVAGTTRDVVDVPYERNGKRYLLLDTAGIRKKGKTDSHLERLTVLMSLKAISRADVCLFLLDASQPVTKQDAHVAGYILESWRPMVIVINKWDLVPSGRRDVDDFIGNLIDEYPFLRVPPLANISAKTGEGVDSIWKMVDSVWQGFNYRIKTSKLNAELEKILDKHPLPVYRGKPVKIFYATETGTRPPSLVVFVNEPEGIHFSYERFLLNELRSRFEFNGAPIKMNFKRKRK